MLKYFDNVLHTICWHFWRIKSHCYKSSEMISIRFDFLTCCLAEIYGMIKNIDNFLIPTNKTSAIWHSIKRKLTNPLRGLGEQSRERWLASRRFLTHKHNEHILIYIYSCTGATWGVRYCSLHAHTHTHTGSLTPTPRYFRHSLSKQSDYKNNSNYNYKSDSIRNTQSSFCEYLTNTRKEKQRK